MEPGLSLLYNYINFCIVDEVKIFFNLILTTFTQQKQVKILLPTSVERCVIIITSYLLLITYNMIITAV